MGSGFSVALGFRIFVWSWSSRRVALRFHTVQGFRLSGLVEGLELGAWRSGCTVAMWC